jgi:hypothetical protein
MTVPLLSAVATAGIALALLLAGTPAGFAQDDDYVRSVQPEPLPEGPAMPEPPPAPHDPDLISTTRLEQFVTAQLEIESIQAETVAKLAATTEEQKARELRQEGEARVLTALERANLTSEEYREIAALIGSEPALEQRVEAKREMLESPR